MLHYGYTASNFHKTLNWCFPKMARYICLSGYHNERYKNTLLSVLPIALDERGSGVVILHITLSKLEKQQCKLKRKAHLFVNRI